MYMEVECPLYTPAKSQRLTCRSSTLLASCDTIHRSHDTRRGKGGVQWQDAHNDDLSLLSSSAGAQGSKGGGWGGGGRGVGWRGRCGR